MFNLSAHPVRIRPGFSLWLACYLLLLHLFALVLILFLDLEFYLLGCLIAIITLSLIYHWRQNLLYQGHNSVIGIDWSANKGWLVRLKDGDKLRAELCPSSIISRYLVVLHFKTCHYGKHKLVLPGDSIDADQFRQLRVLLKMNHFGV